MSTGEAAVKEHKLPAPELSGAKKKSIFDKGKRGKLLYFLFLNLGILMMSVGIYFFKATNGFATGGVSGISILLTKLLPFAITQSTYMLVINAALLVVGFIILGRQCGVLTFYCSLMMSAQNWAFEHFINLQAPLTDHTLLELVYAVMLTGIGAAILFRCNASSGGTDIVALILKKYTHMNVGTALLISDLVIASSSIIIYDVKTGLFSILGLFAKVFVVDDILDSMNMCKAFTIITTKAEEIDAFIMTEMRHGATVYNAEGAYSHQEKKIIVTVCKRTEAVRLRRKVKEIDPHSFIIITKTSEIMGKGFRDV